MSGIYDLAHLAESTTTMAHLEQVIASQVLSAKPDIEPRAPDAIFGDQATQHETPAVVAIDSQVPDQSTPPQLGDASSESPLHERHLWESCGYQTTTNEVFGSFAVEKQKFSSFDEAKAARAAAVNPAGRKLVDFTFPTRNEDWQPYVAMLVQAMVDMSTSTETPFAKKRWETLWSTGGRVDNNGQEKVELMAWDVLEHVDAYHVYGGPVDPATRTDAVVRHGQASFMRHVMDIAAALKDNKAICFDVGKRKEIQIFVDDVEGCLKRKDQNKKSNERRRKRNDGATTPVTAEAGNEPSNRKRKRDGTSEAQDKAEDRASRKKAKTVATPLTEEPNQQLAVDPELDTASAHAGTTSRDFGSESPGEPGVHVQSRQTDSFDDSNHGSQNFAESQLAQEHSFAATPVPEQTPPPLQTDLAESIDSLPDRGELQRTVVPEYPRWDPRSQPEPAGRDKDKGSEYPDPEAINLPRMINGSGYLTETLLWQDHTV